MINLVGVGKGYGSKVLFRGVDMSIARGERVGLVGVNGCGKTTLLSVIGGLDEPDDGSVRIARGTRIGLLPQEVDPRQGGRLMEEMLGVARGIADLETRKAEVEAELVRGTGSMTDDEAVKLAAELGDLEERIHHLGGYSIEAEASTILAGLGFRQVDLDRPLGEFSGGWRMRFELARLLLEDPDLLLLDEPTNHLDIESMQWLEDYMRRFRGALVVISHDRRFIDSTVTRIAAIDEEKVREYKGGWDDFRRMREQEVETAWKHYEDQRDRIKEIEEFIARNKVRKDRAHVVQGRIRQLEKMDRLTPPRARRIIHFDFPQPDRTGSPVAQLRAATKRYGDLVVLSSVDLAVLRGEKVALVGPNGSGKTTLLKLLAGDLGPESGERSWGANVTMAYYAQHQLEALTPRLTVKQEMTSIADRETMPIVRSILGAFMFSDDTEVDKTVAQLSGGERARLALAKLLLRPAGLLLMDEPTNHLDIESREVLERALSEYRGTLVFVSHDRRFINALATRVVEVGGGKLDSFPGSYDDYVEKKRKEAAGASRPQAPARPSAPPRPERQDRQAEARASRDRERERQREQQQRKTKDAERERKRDEAERRNVMHSRLKPMRDEMVVLESEIERHESRVREVERALADPATYGSGDGQRVKDLQQDHAYLKLELDRMMRRWEEVNRSIEILRLETEGGR